MIRPNRSEGWLALNFREGQRDIDDPDTWDTSQAYRDGQESKTPFTSETEIYGNEERHGI